MHLENLITSFPVAKYKFIIQPKEDIVFSNISFHILTEYKPNKNKFIYYFVYIFEYHRNKIRLNKFIYEYDR
jgi:hypothetical protein